MTEGVDVRSSRVAYAPVCLESEGHEVDASAVTSLPMLLNFALLFAIGDDAWLLGVDKIARSSEVRDRNIDVGAVSLCGN